MASSRFRLSVLYRSVNLIGLAIVIASTTIFASSSKAACQTVRRTVVVEASGFRVQDETDTDSQKKKKDKPLSRTEKILVENDIERTREGARLYLSAFIPHNVDDIIAPLVEKLDSPDYRERRRATKELKRVPRISIKSLRRFEESNKDKPERLVRIRAVIKFLSDAQQPEIQHAVLRHITTQEYKGMTEELYQVYPNLSTEKTVRRAAAMAISSSATESNYQLLESILDNQESELFLRISAFRGMWRVNQELALEKVLGHRDQLPAADSLGMDMANKLVEIHHPVSIDFLLALCESEELHVRNQAYYILNRLAGQKPDYVKFRDDDLRETVVDDLRSWIAKNPYEIDYERKSSELLLGRILICDYSNNKIIEYDTEGNEVWTQEAPNPFACMGLPNGHRLVSHYSSQKLVEYDSEGDVFKEFTGLPSNISGIDRIENGNTLIAAGQSGNKVMELDPEGTIIVDLAVDGTPTSVKQMRSGNLLVALFGSSKVVEIDREGNVLHEIDIPFTPYHAVELESGNILISCTNPGKIAEYTYDGELVWEMDNDSTNLYHAQRRADGTTIFADTKGFHRVSLDKEKISESISGFGDYIYAFEY